MLINIGNINLFYEKSGSGQPLLLLHGNGEDHHLFDCIAAKLANHYSVYAIDSRNHGQSSATDDYAYQTMSEDVYAFIHQLTLSPAHIIGFSDGAIIALLLALNHPLAVNKMALLGVNLKPSDFLPECYQEIEEAYAENPDPLLLLMLSEPNIELASLANIAAPTLVIGAEDDIFQPQVFHDIARTIPDAQLMIMVGHDHSSYIDNNDLLYDDFITFFK